MFLASCDSNPDFFALYLKKDPMKHLGIVIALTSLTMSMISCDRDFENEIYQDASMIDTEEAVYTVVQNDLLSPAFRLIELAEVFTGYQEIRSDRSKALEYVKGFFGSSNWVYYEYMSFDRWGKINLNFDGSYTAYPKYWKAFWIGCNMDRTVQIVSPQDHQYDATGTAEDSIYDFNGSVLDGTITMSALHASYSTELFGTPEFRAELEIIESLEMPMCKDGKGKLEPVSGKIRIDYRTRYAKRAFEVEFHDTYKTIILADGTTRDAEPEKAYGWNEY